MFYRSDFDMKWIPYEAFDSLFPVEKTNEHDVSKLIFMPTFKENDVFYFVDVSCKVRQPILFLKSLGRFSNNFTEILTILS